MHGRAWSHGSCGKRHGGPWLPEASFSSLFGIGDLHGITSCASLRKLFEVGITIMRNGRFFLLRGAALIGLMSQDPVASRDAYGAVPAPISSITTVLAQNQSVTPIEHRPASSPQPSHAPGPSNKSGEPSPDASASNLEKGVLAAAAIAALIIAASRTAYYSTGHPCACPEDRTRNGQSCGGRSAYSRPGGAAPLCYVKDVSPSMIDDYRKTAARLLDVRH
jgi:hypothetical protein